MLPGYCVKEDAAGYGFEEIDFDADPDFDSEETKSQNHSDASAARS